MYSHEMTQTVISEARGPLRESQVPADAYQSGAAIARRHIYSIAEQVYLVGELGGGRVLEIGIGNGLAAGMLRGLGNDVVTFDINPQLQPDICGDFTSHDISSLGRFDVVLCCEVLEHLPFEGFEHCVSRLAQIAPAAVVTLPCVRRFWGFGGVFQVPPLLRRYGVVGMRLPLGRKIPPYHCWEIDSSPQTAMRSVRSVFRRHFSTVRSCFEPVNPYHQVFLCKQV
jgi:hypothetical protein